MSEQGAGEVAQTTLKETLQHLISCPSWVNLIIGASLLSITGYGVLMWGYEFYGRVHALSFVDIGVTRWRSSWGSAAAWGRIAGGTICDRLGRRDPGWYMRLPAIVNLVAMPFAVAFLLADEQHSLAGLLLPVLPARQLLRALPAHHQPESRQAPHARHAAAIMLFIINIVGAGAGPLIVGILNDAFTARYGDEAIRYSLLAISMTSVLGSLFLYLSSRTLAADLGRARE